jgi:O-antigen ligase
MTSSAQSLPAQSLPEQTFPDWSQQPLLPWIIGFVLVGAAFVNPIDFMTGAEYERATSSTGPHTFVKLGLAAVAGGFGVLGVLLSPSTRQLLNSVPGAGLLALGALFSTTSFFAIESVRTISIASGIIYFAYLFFICTALTMLGAKRVVACLVAGAALYLMLTWGLFILFPEQGKFIEYTSATESVTRMGGTGHPNIIAKVAVATGLMGLALLTGKGNFSATRERERAMTDDRLIRSLAIGVRGPWWRLMLWGVIFLATATTLATISRTAILAGIAAAGMMLINRLYGRGGVAIAVTTVAAIALLLLGVSLMSREGPFSESAVGVVTKSGDVEELTSLTGRTAIWDEAIGLIAQRPLTGWGLDSAATVMSKRATGTHNLVLHVSFSAGVLAACVMIGLLAWSLLFGATSPHEWIRGAVVLVLVSGLVEDTILESFPSMLTLLWIVALVAPNLVGQAPAVRSEKLAGETRQAFSP